MIVNGGKHSLCSSKQFQCTRQYQIHETKASYILGFSVQSGKIGLLRSVGSISQAPTLETIQEEQDRELQQMRAKIVAYFHHATLMLITLFTY